MLFQGGLTLVRSSSPPHHCLTTTPKKSKGKKQDGKQVMHLDKDKEITHQLLSEAKETSPLLQCGVLSTAYCPSFHCTGCSSPSTTPTLLSTTVPTLRALFQHESPWAATPPPLPHCELLSTSCSSGLGCFCGDIHGLYLLQDTSTAAPWTPS